MKAASNILIFMGYLQIILSTYFIFLCLVGNGPINGRIILVSVFAFWILFGIFHFKVVSGLHNKKFWAWICGVFICSMYITSITFPLGIWGAYDLLKPETRIIFKLNNDRLMAVVVFFMLVTIMIPIIFLLLMKYLF